MFRCKLPTIIYILLSYFLLLTSCTVMSPHRPQGYSGSHVASNADIQRWSVIAKIQVQTAHHKQQVFLRWRQQRSAYTLTFLHPLGIPYFVVKSQGETVILTDYRGRRYQAVTPEALLEQQGLPHWPVSQLQYWVRGIPAPFRPYHIGHDRLTKQVRFLHQDGWLIQYPAYKKVGHFLLPTIIEFTGSGLYSKLVIQQWQLP